MEITINITCDNAAFADDMRGEISRILSEQAKKVRLYPLDGLSEAFTIRDISGNAVGEFLVSSH